MYTLLDEEFFDLKLVLRALENFNEKAHSGTIVKNLAIMRYILKMVEERETSKKEVL